MESAYNEIHAKELIRHYPNIAGELVLRTYTLRLLGVNPKLVLHGGGNTSIKLIQKNILQEDQAILFVKGSGVDLASIEPEEFVALDLAFLKNFRRLEKIEDEEMESQLQIHKLHPSPLNPSVESFLHAFLPHRCVDHTHADSILILTNQKKGAKLIRDALGSKIGILPYTLSGLPLARGSATPYEKNPEIEAIVIINHVIFTFGEDAVTSYERMIDYISRAESFIKPRIHAKTLTTQRDDITLLKEIEPLVARFSQIIRGACAHRTDAGRLCRFRVEYRNTPDLLLPLYVRRIRINSIPKEIKG